MLRGLSTPALVLLGLGLGLALAACAETQLAVHTVKEIMRRAQPAPPTTATYKLGDPYRVNGVWYIPAVDPDYDRSGIASWYGEPFHRRTTANGDTYDMNALTAAHPTLPMPSRVRVTNLENGRSVFLTINDRGPFVKGRIIDVSRRAAELLGFEGKGTAKVRVEAAPESAGPLLASAQAPGPASESRIALASLPSGPTGLYIQAGAFANSGNAATVEARLRRIAPTEVTPVTVDGRVLYRVRLGPVTTRAAAATLLEKVIASGYADARLVFD
ncbi:MAG: septal ring lytic transglycosylase RlpA family protein [Alphaproteobacteria bacterium]